MPIQKQSYQIQGMRQDNLVATGHSTKFAHEIMNMRLNTIGDYTTASWTTEKGTKEELINAVSPMGNESGSVSYKWITDYNYNVSAFKPLGQAVINNTWVLFGKVEPSVDMILVLKYDKQDNLQGRVLYKGNLNFDSNYPIETLPFYENEMIQKIYWTDGKNQPRLINIKGAEDLTDGFDSSITTQFNFVQEVSLNEEVDITKLNSGTGLFPPCTVKYCLTYYHKYGQETNIVYDSPLYYPTLGERACSPDEISGDSFKIVVNGIDNTHGFDYIRLYSIVRTSDNATPIVRIVEDKPIDSTTTSVIFFDTNTTGSIVDPTILNYVGGTTILAETFDQKDNTLFLGNITLKNKSLTNLLNVIPQGGNTTYANLMRANAPSFEYKEDYKIIPVYYKLPLVERIPVSGKFDSFYKYVNQLNSSSIYTHRVGNNNQFVDYKGNSFNIKNFKSGEYYRVGIQFQDKYGVWSEVIRLKDSILCDKIPTQFTGNDAVYKLPVLQYTLASNISSYLISNDYKKARLVCCYTTNSDRTFITQGVVNQTVYNYEDAGNGAGTPYAQASWFFRPFGVTGDIGPSNPNSTYSITEKEVQSIQPYSLDTTHWPPTPTTNSPNPSRYYTRNNYWTLNSPDIELDESIRTLDSRAFKLKHIGDFSMFSIASSIYVDATSPAPNSMGETNTGLSGTTYVDTTTSLLDQVKSHNFDFCKWKDCDVYYSLGGNSKINYPLIPFQRSTSLNNYVKDMKWRYYGDDEGDTDITIRQHAKLSSKVFANLIYSKNSTFNNTTSNLFNNTDNIQFFDSNEITPLMFGSKVYYGNCNTIANINNSFEENIICGQHSESSTKLQGSYYIYRFDGATSRTNIFYEERDNTGPCSVITSDPVTITYKSTPHIVFTGRIDSSYESNVKQFYLTEIYRNIEDTQRFGGINNKNNVYIPCGPATTLNSNSNTVLYGYEGDHYLMRYDCLKTYPFTTEDVNQIVEIMSFMCETRINLDGRYDKNRGLIDNTYVLPTNFNLINRSYTQSNNFFNYTELKDDKIAAELDKFPNQITWTKEKVSGEDVDAWTNITLASTADADGTVGKISKIINLNDRLFLFQDHALAQINYNENTAISTEANIPLELAKTGKFTGFNYITKEIGCQNKWSISSTKNGLLWIDDSRQELLRYGEGIQSLSTTLGFDAFMIKQLPTMFKAWNPSDFDNFVTYYDKLSNDVYYINKNTCLAWNEQTGTFTSFYNYENTPYMASLGSHSVMWHNGIWAARESDNYSTFFNTSKDYWMTLVCDGMVDKGNAFPADKVFNNVEYRADIYNLDGTNTNYSVSVFNKKQAWNGYQDSNECPLDGIRKFNTWRIQLPRNYGTRDRIRNPFCYIKLKQDQSVNLQTDRVILHDLAVYFDMK